MKIVDKNGKVEIYADKGKLLTNGDECGEAVFLAESDSVSNWYEIDKKEG